MHLQEVKCVFLYHVLVVLVAEVENRLRDFELVENFVVSRHVGGQNTSVKVFFY